MAVLDTAAKYRETLLYNRYQAARDNIERFRKEPPFAYVIPHQQRDLPPPRRWLKSCSSTESKCTRPSSLS